MKFKLLVAALGVAASCFAIADTYQSEVGANAMRWDLDGINSSLNNYTANGKYYFNAVKTDKNGNYSINLPQNSTTFITYRFTGTNGAILPTNKIPAILNLATNLNLDNVDVIYKKPRYYWLLLLIPLYYLIKKK